ncbi:MAG: uridine kinase family protein [Syntrophothermus sp.]
MENIYSPEIFSKALFEIMKDIDPALQDLELYEFQYALKNVTPEQGWKSIHPVAREEIEARLNCRSFYDSIRIKPRVEDRIVLDENIVQLTDMLFAGLVTRFYDETWVRQHFYFDVRGFYFLHRTSYFTEPVLAHLGGRPFRQFEQKQKAFVYLPELGYKVFREANAEVDNAFIESVHKLIAARGVPVLLAIAGPTAAGKTEIVERLRTDFDQAGRKTTSIELDNFLTDREYREEKGIFTQGREALHFELFKQSLQDITAGKRISIPRYDFVYATSSHDLQGNLKPDGVPIEIEPADIIFIEGNFPFLIEEVADLIGIKVVYLTDDPIRLKRKWKRDIDYRKKYEPTYFRNRYFKDQFIMAEIAYRPQMAMCDMVVDTTGAALWTTPEVASILNNC